LFAPQLTFAAPALSEKAGESPTFIGQNGCRCESLLDWSQHEYNHFIVIRQLQVLLLRVGQGTPSTWQVTACEFMRCIFPSQPFTTILFAGWTRHWEAGLLMAADAAAAGSGRVHIVVAA
jgi:hypothetical protein